MLSKTIGQTDAYVVSAMPGADSKAIKPRLASVTVQP